MTRQPFLFLATLCLLFCLQTEAQPWYEQPLSISEEKWLPNRSINCIFQDSEGLLWVGTNSGLYEYDGYGVRHYATTPDKTNSIFTNTVTALAEDLKGNLLVGTESGLSFLQKTGRRFTTLSDRIGYYDHIAPTSKGDLFLSVNQKPFLYRFSPGYHADSPPRIVPVFPLPDAVRQQVGSVGAMAEANQETLLLGSEKGLFLLNLKTKTVSPTGITNPVISLLVDGTTVWVGTNGNGLHQARFARGTVVAERTYHFGKVGMAGYDQINNLLAGPSGRLLVSTPNHLYEQVPAGSGFAEMDPVAPILSENNLLSMYYDKSVGYVAGTVSGST
jgi:ligand-binding sensor domain-containing protein